jgi:hypothetical protein
MKNFLSHLVFLLRNVFGNGRNYCCLPDASRDPQPTEKVGAADTSFPKSSNPVEKDGSLL